jgi:hypothetical protein
MDVYGRLREVPTVEGRKYWGKKSYRTVTLLSQIQHRLTSERTLDFGVRERGVIACSMAHISTQTIEKQIYCMALMQYQNQAIREI